MDATVGLRDVSLITTSPTNFAGAATVHARTLAMLAQAGISVFLVVGHAPFLNDELLRSGVAVRVVQVESDAYPGSDAISASAIAAGLADCAAAELKAGRRVVLCGTYLFPYGQSVAIARALLRRSGILVPSIIIPAGSDIWQVGAQLPALVAMILSSTECEALVSYSKRFLKELKEYVNALAPAYVIPPSLDLTAFSPVSADDRSRLRDSLGIARNAFVLINCSNMRPVKRIDASVDFARALQQRLDKKVDLVLVGPRTDHAANAIGRRGNVNVLQTGLIHDTAPYHRVADLAINTSAHDSFNISVAESLACGTPVVTTDCVGILELEGMDRVCATVSFADDAVAALHDHTSAPLTPSSVKGALDFAHDLSRRRRNVMPLRMRCRSFAEEAFNPQRTLALWSALLSEVLGTTQQQQLSNASLPTLQPV